MKKATKFGISILGVFIAFQFINPVRNKSGQVLPADIINTVIVPQNIQVLLKRACYDCHSNNTNYVWYDNIQPGRWWVEHHITEGKANLNFSEFGTYSHRKQENKLKAIGKSIKEESMPIVSYTMMHKNARLTVKEKELIIVWAQQSTNNLSEKN